MEFNIDFNVVRSQKLLLIPQLKQAIEILEMDSRELFHYVEKQLYTNPALEEAADEAVPDGPAYQEASGTMDFEQYSQMNDQMIERTENSLTLKQHLLLQLEALCLDKSSYIIGEYLIDNTDDNGYLKADTEEAAAFLEVSEYNVHRVLEKLQLLDPPGICARNISECLLIQLRQLEQPDNDAELIVERYLDAVADNDAVTVAHATGMKLEHVYELFGRIRSLEPKPGREYYGNDIMSRTLPDIIIQDTREELQVVYNEEAFPNVCISKRFTTGLKHTDIDRPNYMREWFKSAVWLIKCLEQREDIIFTIAQKICDFRREFFTSGPGALRLIDRHSFASQICLHESILDKALTGKYLQCRWGLYELRSFFKEA